MMKMLLQHIPNKLTRLSILILHIIAPVALGQSPVFLVHPTSIAAIDGSTVEFTCTANNTDTLTYRVNGTSATLGSVTSKGFNQLDGEELDTLVIRRNLSVTVSSLYNNTEILCRAVGDSIVDSNTATLTVQGPLFSVDDLSYSFIDSSTINILWSPPFTLPGTHITGYTISVTTSNGTTTDYYTSNSYHVLLLTDITDSPCDQITICVSGYNGLNGEDESISGIFLPSAVHDNTIPIDVDISNNWHLSLIFNVTEVCNGQHPTIVDVSLVTNDGSITSATNIELPIIAMYNNSIIRFDNVLMVQEDQMYTVVGSLSNLDGAFGENSTATFNTFGVQSVSITNTTGNRVCLQCVFSSFSTDSGCTVELVDSGTTLVHYFTVFNRSTNIAEGCITNVTSGLYDIRVYDQGSNVVVVTITSVNVTDASITTVIRTTTASNTDSMTSTVTMPVLPSATPTNTKGQDDDTSVALAVTLPVLLLVITGIPIVGIIYIVWCGQRKGKGIVIMESNFNLSPLPEPNNEYQQHELKIVIDADGVESNYAQVDHSGIAPFAPLPIPPTIYSDIDHMRTEMKRDEDTPPVIPPRVVDALNAGFSSNNKHGSNSHQ